MTITSRPVLHCTPSGHCADVRPKPHTRCARFAAVVLSPSLCSRPGEENAFGRPTFWRVELTTSKVLTFGVPAKMFFRISNTSG